MNKSSPNVGLVYCLSIGIDENDTGSYVLLRACSEPHIPGTCHRTNSGSLLHRNSKLQFWSSVHVLRPWLGYDTELQLHGGEDWQMYFALSEVCEFAVLPEYLVGYRQAPGSQSRDVSRMAESIDCVIQWLTERWPTSEDLRREREYDRNF